MKLKLRQLDLNLLRVFDALMQERNLTRAARQLHMSQPAVSNALARLRSHLNDPLFIRCAGGMEPTVRAQMLQGPVREALALLQASLVPEQAFDSAADHHFRLSMNDYDQTRLLPALVPHLARCAPKVRLSVQRDDAMTLPQRLASGDVDLVIDYLHFSDHDLRYQHLHDEELVVIGRVGHPAFAGGLTREAYQLSAHVALDDRAGRGSPLEILIGAVKARRRVQVYVPNFLVIPAIVGASDLLGTVPRPLAEQMAAIHQLQFAPLPFDMPRVELSLIWHRQQDHAPALRWLVEQFLDASARLSRQP
jgi:DNA-binding transcriptional LysR family regulator